MGWKDTIQEEPLDVQSEQTTSPTWKSSIQEEPSTWEKLRGTGNMEEQAASAGVGLSKGAFLPVEIANKLLPGQADPDLRHSLIAKIEKVIGENLGDEQTKAYYRSLSDEELRQRNIAKEQETTAKAPLAAIGGELVGSLPAQLAAGGAIGAAAKGISGITATEQAAKLAQVAPEISTAMRAGQAATNIAGAGVLGEAAGIGMSNAPTLEERAKEALPMAQTGAMGGLAAESALLAARGLSNPAIQGALPKAIGTPLKYGGAAVAGAAAFPLLLGHNPIHYPILAGEGALLGIMAPSLLESTGPGQTLKKSYEYGKKGVSLFKLEDWKRATKQAEELAGQISKDVSALDTRIGKTAADQIVANTNKLLTKTGAENIQAKQKLAHQLSSQLYNLKTNLEEPAIQQIGQNFDQYVQQIGQQFGVQTDTLFGVLKDIHDDVGIAIGNLYKDAGAAGIQFKEKVAPVIDAYKKSFQQALKNGTFTEEGKANAKTILSRFDDFLYEPSKPMTFTAGEETQPFKGTTEFYKAGGKNLSLEELSKQMNASPEQIKQILLGQEVSGIQVQPKSAQITAAENQLFGPTQKAQETFQAKVQTPRVELDAADLRELQKLGSEWGYNKPGADPAIQGIAKQFYKDLKEATVPLFNTETGNPLAQNNRIYTALKVLGEDIGVSMPDKLTKENFAPENISKMLMGLEKTVAQGDIQKLNRINNSLEIISPFLAEHFQEVVRPLMQQKIQLGALKSAPALEKAAILPQTPEIQQASKSIQDIEALQQQLGEPLKIGEQIIAPTKTESFVGKITQPEANPEVDAILKLLEERNPQLAAEIRQQIPSLQTGATKEETLKQISKLVPEEQISQLPQAGVEVTPELQTAAGQVKDISQLKERLGTIRQVGEEELPSFESRKFIEDLHDLQKTGEGTDLNATLNLLKKYNPELAQKLKTAGVDLSTQLKIIGEPGKQIPHLTRPFHYIQQGAARIAHMAGSTVGKLEKLPPISFAAKSLSALNNIVKSSPQVLGKFAAPLRAASDRGLTALSAMHYALYQNDPEYRAIIDPLHKEGEAATKETP